TMTAAGTADRNHHVGPVFARELWQPTRHETVDVFQHARRLRLAFEIIDDRLFPPGVWAQLRHPVRIGQAAGVEYKVGGLWHAALETERLQQDRHFAGRGFDAVANQIA